MTIEPELQNPFQSPNVLDQESEDPSPLTVKDQQPWSPPYAVICAAALLAGGIVLQSILVMSTEALMVNHRATVGCLVLGLAFLVPRRGAWVYMICYLSLLIIIPVVSAVLLILHFFVPDPSGADLPQLSDILLCLLPPAVCYVGALACLLGRKARAFYFRSKV